MFTDFAKNSLMATEEFDANDKYVALGTESAGTVTELTGHGYSRGAWLTGNMTVAATGVVTGSQFTIYTATDGDAVQATRTAIFDAATAGNQITEWETIANPPAPPANGRSVNITPRLVP